MKAILEYLANLSWGLESSLISAALFGEYEYPSEDSEN